MAGDDDNEPERINPIDNPESVEWSEFEKRCWEAVAMADSRLGQHSRLTPLAPDEIMSLLFARADAIGAAAACRTLADQQRMTRRLGLDNETH